MTTKSYQAWAFQAQTKTLALVEKTLPALAADEICIENQAIGLNPVDFKVIRGAVLTDGQTAGVDGAGVVVAVGSDSLQHLIGKRVAYHTNLRADGSFAQYTQLKASVVITMPDAMGFDLAASLPCPLMTAWQAVEKIPAKAGANVLVSGASGSVGRYLVQLLNARGFEVSVTANANRHQELKQLGASQCFDMTHNFEDKSFFAIFDSRSPQSAESLMPAIMANGHMICIQGRIETHPLPGFSRCVSVHEIALGALHQQGSLEQWQELTQVGEAFLTQILNGELVANTIHSLPFAQLAQGLHEFEHDRKALKYVITV